METILSKRTKQIQKSYDNLPLLEDVYCKIGYDFAVISDSLIESLTDNRNKKREIKADLGDVSMAVFNREYELSDEYIILKSCKYELKGLEKLMTGLRIRIESLKAQLKGEY